MHLLKSALWHGLPARGFYFESRAGSPCHKVLASLVFICLTTGGCASTHQPAALVQSPPFDLPAKQMMAQVKQIVQSPPISLSVQDEQDGTIMTDWQPFRGELHIVRYWHERTRYHITIVPDFNEPSRRSRIQVADETEQRPEEEGLNEKAHEWSAAPDLHRPERSQNLLQQIETELGQRR